MREPLDTMSRAACEMKGGGSCNNAGTNMIDHSLYILSIVCLYGQAEGCCGSFAGC